MQLKLGCLGCFSKGAGGQDVSEPVESPAEDAVAKPPIHEELKQRGREDFSDCSTIPSEPTPECRRSTTMMTDMTSMLVEYQPTSGKAESEPSDRPESPLPPDREPADEQPAAHLPIRNAPESPGNAAHSQGPSPCNRRRDAFKKMGKRVTARLTVKFKKLLRKQSTVRSAAGTRSLPDVEIPPKPPLTSHMIQQATVSKIWSVLKRLDACPLIQFLSQAGNCYDFHTTPWVACNVIPGAQVRKCCYMAPVPEDVPGFARRLLNVPDQLSSTSVWRLVRDPEEMRFVQHSYTSDVLYGDRFKVQCTVRFREQTQGVVVDQWCDIVWDKPLPWTHGVVRHFIEHRARHDAMAMGGDLVRCIQDALESQDLALEHSEDVSGPEAMSEVLSGDEVFGQPAPSPEEARRHRL